MINPNSYIHAIIIINNGTIKFLAHENKMDIPIYNSIFEDSSKNDYKNNYLNLKKLNNLNLLKPDTKKFNLLKILKLIPQKDSLFETVVISVNDELVNKFLNKEIDYKNISYFLMKIINFKKLKKYCKVKPKTIKQITEKNWSNLIETNLKAPLFLSKVFYPELKKRKGVIINIIDIHVDPPLKNHIISFT